MFAFESRWLTMCSILLAILFVYGCDDDGDKKTTDTSQDTLEETSADTIEETTTDTIEETTDTIEETTADTVEETTADVADTDTEDVVQTVDCAAIADSITAGTLNVHLVALDTIGTANNNTRVAGSAGWDASVVYAKGVLEDAGYTVTEQEVTYPYGEELSEPVLTRTLPTARTYTFAADDTTPVGDFQAIHLSLSGDLVDVAVTAVDLDLTPDNTSTSGCEADDFVGFPTGNIALLQRGTCYFTDKAANAQAAGASAMILINQGNNADRMGLMAGGVAYLPGDDFQVAHNITIPGVFATYAVGEEIAAMLANGDTVTMSLKVDNLYELRTTKSLIAETTGGNASEKLIVGAHLDSVTEGPGINDNGTGVAAVLEMARVSAQCTPTRKIAFALWGAEEWGLWGAKTYLLALSDSDRGNILGYLNIDMLGSKNAKVILLDSDGSNPDTDWGLGSAEGGAIEAILAADLTAQTIPFEPTMTDRADHFPFALMGVPWAGLATGAEGLKTADEVAIYGGTADQPYDPCYHLACDTLDNVDMTLATKLAGTYARAVQYFGIDGN